MRKDKMAFTLPRKSSFIVSVLLVGVLVCSIGLTVQIAYSYVLQKDYFIAAYRNQGTSDTIESSKKYIDSVINGNDITIPMILSIVTNIAAGLALLAIMFI